MTPPSFDMGGIQSGLKKGDEMREKKSFLKFKTSLPTHVSEHENDNLKINMRKNFYLGRRPAGRGQTPCYKSLSRLFCARQTLEMKSKQQINPHPPPTNPVTLCKFAHRINPTQIHLLIIQLVFQHFSFVPSLISTHFQKSVHGIMEDWIMDETVEK